MLHRGADLRLLIDNLRVELALKLVVLVERLVIEQGHVANVWTSLNLVLPNDFLIEVCNLVAVVDLLLSIKIDSSIIHTQLIKSKERNRSIMKVQEKNLGQALGAVDLFLLLFNPFVEVSDPVDLRLLRLER